MAIFAMTTRLRRLGNGLDGAPQQTAEPGSAFLGGRLVAQAAERGRHGAFALSAADDLQGHGGPWRRPTHAPGELVGSLDWHVLEGRDDVALLQAGGGG